MFYLPLDKLLQNTVKTGSTAAPVAPTPVTPLVTPTVNNNTTNLNSGSDINNLGRIQGGYSQ